MDFKHFLAASCGTLPGDYISFDFFPICLLPQMSISMRFKPTPLGLWFGLGLGFGLGLRLGLGSGLGLGLGLP